jgi:hypothetical protein
MPLSSQWTAEFTKRRLEKPPHELHQVSQYHGWFNFVQDKPIGCSQSVLTWAHDGTYRKQWTNQISADHRGKDFTRRTCQVNLYPMAPTLRDGPKLGVIPGHAASTRKRTSSDFHRGVRSVSMICHPHNPTFKLWISTGIYKCYRIYIAKNVYVIQRLRKPAPT